MKWKGVSTSHDKILNPALIDIFFGSYLRNVFQYQLPWMQAEHGQAYCTVIFRIRLEDKSNGWANLIPD